MTRSFLGNSGGGILNCFSSFDRESLTFVDRKGYILRYRRNSRDNTIRLIEIIASDVLFPPGTSQGKPFDSSVETFGRSPYSTVHFSPLIVDKYGIYQLTETTNATSKIEKLLDRLIDQVAIANNPSRFVIFSENRILEYQLLDDQGSDRWWSNPTNHAGDSDELYYGNARYPNVLSSQSIPNLTAKLVRSVDIPLEYQGRAVCQFGFLDSGYLINGRFDSYKTTVLRLTFDGETEEREYINAKPIADANLVPSVVCFGLVPPGVTGVIFCSLYFVNPIQFSQLQEDAERDRWTFILGGIVLCVGAVSSAIFSIWLLSSRGVSRRNIRLWVFGSVLLGVAAPLAIVAIYPKLIRERCKTCGKTRRVDLVLCEACGASWGPAEPSDITIIDAKAAFS